MIGGKGKEEESQQDRENDISNLAKRMKRDDFTGVLGGPRSQRR
jgi:hypothetical protein